MTKFPTISFVIPTLNASKILGKCLNSIQKQQFPKNKIEIIIVDGGSIDKTLEISQRYNCIIIKNPLKTAEAGKALGIKNVKNKYTVLMDSDNILPKTNWLKQMLLPLETDNQIIGSEPWRFTYRPNAGFIERYCALIGANDPYALITGVFDKKSYLNNNWTNLKNIKTKDFPAYVKIKLKPKQPIPTIGANGTIFRSSFLKSNFNSDYFFDIDIITEALAQKSLYFAKTKIDIIHTFCESSVLKFIKKQNRRIVDYYTYQKIRHFNWQNTNKYGVLKFSLYTIFIVPAFFDSIKGFLKKPDLAWFFHPLACLLSFGVYTLGTIKYKLNILNPINRNGWKQ